MLREVLGGARLLDVHDLYGIDSTFDTYRNHRWTWEEKGEAQL